MTLYIKNTRKYLLIFIFFTGLPFQMCTKVDDDNICKCEPIIGKYFDINGIKITNYKKRGECCADKLLENDVVMYEDYFGFSLEYKVDYITCNKNATKKRFPLINSAYACTCLENGMNGSKNEQLNNLIVITINDFDDKHLANDTINDIIMVGDRYLNDYLQSDTALIQHTSLKLNIDRKPTLNENFKLKIIVELSTGERYQEESESIIIK